jgi:hypothetical protein
MAHAGGVTTCTASSEAVFELKGKEGTRLSRDAKNVNRSVLVVDDLCLNRMVLGKLLASFGFAVAYSRDGQEAVQEFQRRKESNEELYAILMVRALCATHEGFLYFPSGAHYEAELFMCNSDVRIA